MKTCKKLFSLLLVAVMLVAAIPTFAFADEGDNSNAATPQATQTEITTLYVKHESASHSEFQYTMSGYSVDYDDRRTVDISEADKLLAAAGHTLSEFDGGKAVVKEVVVNVPKTAASITLTDVVTPPATSSKKTVIVTVDGNSNTYTEVDYNGSVSTSINDVQAVLTAAGAKNINLDKYNVASADLDSSNNTITIVLTSKPYEGYTLNLTVKGSNNASNTVTYRDVTSYSGDTSNVSNVLSAFKVTGYDLNNYNVTKNEYVASTKTFNIELTAKPTDADKYTVVCNVNGTQFSSKTNVTYTGGFESTVANAEAILKAASITTSKAVSDYKNVSISKSSSGVITVDLRDTATIKVYNNATTYSQITMEVGRPYVNYLGTTIINNSTFGGITVKDNSGASRFYTASQVTGGTAVVNLNDMEVTIQRNGDSCTLNFLKSDGTILETRKLYAGDQIGTLPSYTVGGVAATWTYNGKPIASTDTYNFKTTSVNIIPYFGGISDVYVDVYINGNVKTMQTRVKVTDLVQNGVLYLNNDVKTAIASALRNSSNKNLSYTAFFDASTWSDYIKSKNSNGAAEPYRVGDNSERQGAVYLYVMVNNATVKATDSTNPKTGDNVKLGVAAAVLAVAVVGFGAVIVVNKKKGVQ